MNQDLENLKREVLNGVSRLINISALHQKTFSEFKNKFYGKTVVLVGAGPTLNYFKPIKDAIYVGVNRAFLKKDIKFDYLFTIDKGGLETVTKDYFEQFFNYRGNKCVKFVGDQNFGQEWQIPEGKIIGKNIKRYKTVCPFMEDRFTLDIDREPLGNFTSVTLQAMQFILFCNPKKVYLAGIDCTIGTKGHFIGDKSSAVNREEDLKNSNNKAIESWKGLGWFKYVYYPDTEIISVNPVGLKGLFQDIYTEEYLQSELINSNYFEKLTNKLKDKKVILYGAGKLLERYMEQIDISKLNILGISDKKFLSFASKFNKTIFGYNKILPNKIKNYNPDCVLVATYQDKRMIDILKNTTLKNCDIEIKSLYRD